MIFWMAVYLLGLISSIIFKILATICSSVPIAQIWAGFATGTAVDALLCHPLFFSFFPGKRRFKPRGIPNPQFRTR